VKNNAQREEADQILLFVILDIQHHILEVVRKAGSDRECLFGIANADTAREHESHAIQAREMAIYMWVTPKLTSVSSDLEATNGPRRRPGRISWHSLRISYLQKRQLFFYALIDLNAPK